MTHLSAAVREDLCWVDHKSDPQQCHGKIRPEVRAAVEAPHVGDHRLEELKHHHGEDEELDGQPVDLVIVLDLARSVDCRPRCLPNGLLRLGLEAGQIGALVVLVDGLTAFDVVESDKCDSKRTAETFLCQPFHLLLQPCDLIRVVVNCRHLNIIISDHHRFSSPYLENLTKLTSCLGRLFPKFSSFPDMQP